jgi:DNA-directed RNA polymerase specialized sigma24 family protein
MTSQFLDKRLKETGGLDGKLMTLLRATLSKKLPVSAAYGTIDDIIQTCFTKLLKNDAFRGRLADGHNVTDSQIVMFAIRTGYTEIRNAGTEPVERERCGARTERERQKGLPEPTCGGDPKIIWDPEEYGEYDLVDLSSSLRPEATQDRIEFYGVWGEVEKVIKKKRLQTGKQSARVLWGAEVEGFTIKEIAEKEELTPHRVSFLLSQARGLVKEAVARGQIAAP